MRPFTNKEWDELPHVILTADTDWNPSILDDEQEDHEEWFNALEELPSLASDPLFDEFGDCRLIHQVTETSIKMSIICGYLSRMKHGSISFRTHLPDYSDLPGIEHDWFNVYGELQELVPENAPPPLGKPVVLTHYVDANLFHDMLTGRSVTGIIHLMNGTPIDWYTKKQATVETATYGSEFVAARTCVEQIIDIRTTLRYLGVPICKTSYMFGDNESVVNSSTNPYGKLHKRHTALSFHRVREAVAAKIVAFHYLPGSSNPADIMSKHWGYSTIWPMLQCLLFWQGDTIDLKVKD